MLILLLVVVSCESSSTKIEEKDSIVSKEVKEIKWVISHTPEKYFLEAAETFKEMVEEKSKGSLKVKIISISDLNSTGWVKDGEIDIRIGNEKLLHNGQADLVQVSTKSLLDYNPLMAVFDTHRLFKDYEHVDSFVEGPIGEKILGGFEDSPLKALAFTFSGGWMVFVSVDGKEISRLSDLRGKTVRHPTNTASPLLYEELGLIPVRFYDEKGRHLNFKEYINFSLTNLLEVNYFDIFATVETEEVDSILLTDHRVLFTTLVMKRDFFEKLSGEEQNIVQEAATKVARLERYAIKADRDLILKSEEFSHLLKKLSPEDEKEMQRIAIKAKEELKKIMGEDIISDIEGLAET